MNGIAPKRYQQEAVDQALAIFRHAEDQIRQAPDLNERRIASAYNGCVLLEAPTGSGKTLMAGMIAEAFSRPGREGNARIVWFWFTPFAGLVDQARGALKKDFPGLRVRDIQIDRITRNARSGDCFVTTWAAVAANNKETRRVRKGGDSTLALDEFIAQLRQDGFRIGAVVDEAHHTFFTTSSEAVRFYHEVLAPDFTLMVTATPNDRDVERFKQASGIKEVHRNAVSRRSAVEAGLIKEGVRSVAFLAGPQQQALVNFAETALKEAWTMHQRIARELAAAGIDLVPLMLVQVGNSDQAVAQARAFLIGLGVPEARIASYTAKEPSNDLLAVALDEQFEVLIFKMAVALGFDAPRAFVLASLRGAKDTDFGIQVVGRILRVHRRLQPATLEKTLPAGLRYGYVFLADADNQGGLVSAGERINAIRDELAKICPATSVFRVAGEAQVQVAVNGQGSLFRVLTDAPDLTQAPDGETETGTGQAEPLIGAGYPLPGTLDLFGDGPAATLANGRAIKGPPALGQPMALPPPGRHPLRADAQPILKTERMPISTADLLSCIAAHIGFDDTVINVGLRVSVTLTRKTIDLFEGTAALEEAHARLEAKALAEKAQLELFHFGCLHPAELFQALLGRLRTEFRHRGLPDDEPTLERALNLIMATQPTLLRRAERECASRFKEVIDTAHWPATTEALPGAERSRLNVYGVMPDGLNRLELAFAQMLDADQSGAVAYWYRNEPHKPWSVALVLPSGAQFFPDFIVKVNGRRRGDGCVLIETKGDYLVNSPDTIAKVNAEHKFYGSALFLKQDTQGRFMTVSYFEKAGRCEEDQVFRLENLVGH
ncbi:DEAD/DEAH box helicase family protein [uncultured Thiodictyon sp.]|uniref:DEAD/DEAH box helicase n=1 Tax=uncultured Thiodictyon sp. TaxID=1846217 RepID=UPI0025F6B246|nr:DEAD/DEAH box helicase family protein [uncultured Thiodictyon sp.]